MGHTGNLQSYNEKGAFGQALTCVLNTVFNHRIYPMTKWESILHLANRENIAKEKHMDEEVKLKEDMWNKRRMAYKWRRRR